MSHYSVLVVLPADTELPKLEAVIGQLMDRWDENRSVDRYRDYEDGSADEHWWAKSLKRDAEKHGTATYESELADARRQKEDRPYERWTPEERAADEMRDIEQAAGWVGKFGAGPWTWTQLAEAYNARFHPGNEVATLDDDSDNERILVDEDGRAYTWSTRNPEAKWDYWRIGGRWRGYFVATGEGAGPITAEKSWDSPDQGPGDGRKHCDGGPRSLLDFDAMRDARAAEQLERYDRWQTIVDKHGVPVSWSFLRGLVEAGEITIEQARKQYNAHPAIVAANDRDDPLTGFLGDPAEEQFGTTREEFERLARLSAVPGYALVTLEGEWMAPGQMGWFGMSSDEAGEREAYHVEANRYLDALDPDVFVVALDCHI